MRIASRRNLMLSTLAAVMMIGLSLSSVSIAQSTSADQEREQARQGEIRRRTEDEQRAAIGRLKDRFLSQVEKADEMLAQLSCLP